MLRWIQAHGGLVNTQYVTLDTGTCRFGKTQYVTLDTRTWWFVKAQYVTLNTSTCRLVKHNMLP
jgi:hypothetical protein